ncbi:MAG: hypothetical protein CMF49_08935 [Legionellales bacterium]|nr:hypothetical protein [Legionellales bacterium]
MKKTIIAITSFLIITPLFAGTVIYESQGAQGETSFSGQADPNTPEKTIIVNTPDASNNANNNIEPSSNAQNNAQDLSQKLTQQNQKLYDLQQQLSEAQAALDSAKTSLNTAQTAQEQGKTTIGGDQYLDSDLIRHLQQNLAEAEANYQQALDAYNNYRNNPDEVVN